MAKWSGIIGFVMPETEVKPGIWKPESIAEKKYCGDLIRDTRRNQSNTESVNDDITISNQISIVATPFAMQNFYCIKYVKFMGVAWKVTSVDASQPPRLVLSLGGVYNGEQA